MASITVLGRASHGYIRTCASYERCDNYSSPVTDIVHTALAPHPSNTFSSSRYISVARRPTSSLLQENFNVSPHSSSAAHLFLFFLPLARRIRFAQLAYTLRACTDSRSRLDDASPTHTHTHMHTYIHSVLLECVPLPRLCGHPR